MLVLVYSTGCGANDCSMAHKEATWVASFFAYDLYLQIPIKTIAEGNIIIIFNLVITLGSVFCFFPPLISS